MKHLNIRLKIFFALAIVMATQSCYYDNEEYLYPGNQACDTTSVTYSATIVPLISARCNVCHSTTVASGGVITDTYEELNSIATNGRLIGVITHASGFSPMPKGGSKLSECDIKKIQNWVSKGSPQN